MLYQTLWLRLYPAFPNDYRGDSYMINARLLKHSATEVSSYTLLNICTFYFRFGQVPLWSNYYLCSSHTSGGIAYIYSHLTTLKIVEAEILNISKLVCVLTGKARKARVFQVHRQKGVSNFRNEAFNKTPINVGNTTCSVTAVIVTYTDFCLWNLHFILEINVRHTPLSNCHLHWFCSTESTVQHFIFSP